MKIPIQKIDVFTNDIENSADPWLDNKHIIAAKERVSVCYVEFKYSDVFNETIIYVNGNFYGYAGDIWSRYIW